MHELHEMGVVDVRDAVSRGDVSAVEVARSLLDRVIARNDALGAYLHIDAEGALAAAAAVDRHRKTGDTLPPLAGVPIALKDVLCARGAPTTCGSRILEGYRPPYDATVVTRLRGAGAVLLGKTNMDEFAMGSSTENSAYGPTRNPWSLEHAPGGSSGGSAAATSAGLCSAALGTDTGGSIRQPAALTGIVGIKPTYGRVSRYGLVAFASSLDQAGPFARSVRDAACVLRAIAGPDPRDATSVEREVPDYEAELGSVAPRSLRVGFDPAALDGAGLHADVRDGVQKALETLRELGASVRPVPMPHARYALSAYYLIAPAEASSNLARFDGMRYGLRVPGSDLRETYAKTRGAGFGAEVKRRIMLGTYVLSAGYYDAFYLRAQKVRTLVARDFERAFAGVDVLVGPTSPTPAFRLGERTDDPLVMYLGDVFTLPASLAGLPSMSVPCGLSRDGLPIGLQITAPAFEEARLLSVAHAYEQATEWSRARPPGF